MRSPRPAEHLLRTLGVVRPEEIDVESIGWCVGVDVRYQSLDSCEARIIGYGDKAIVTVDPRRSRPRLRFSVAHELGHWKHHRGRAFVCRSDDIGSGAKKVGDPERIADAYAADLLMPEYIFSPVVRQFHVVNFDSVRKMADIFGTSMTATALRFLDLRVAPAIVVCHGVAGRKWFRRSRDVPERWFPRAILQEGSDAFALLHEGQSESTDYGLVDAADWFDSPGASGCEIYEHSTRVGADILSLLVFSDDEMLEEGCD